MKTDSLVWYGTHCMRPEPYLRPTAICVKDLAVDLPARRVLRGGAEVPLTPQEFALLKTLLLNRNCALSRAKLLNVAWGYRCEGNTRTVDVHIQRLRRKLGLEKEIQTVFKVGYRLCS